jgi:type III secretion protein S
MLRTQIVNLAYKALLLILLLSGPPILISLILGLGVAIFQAATQIQEQNLAFTVKLVAVVFTLIFIGAWLGTQIMQFAHDIFINFYRWVGR